MRKSMLITLLAAMFVGTALLGGCSEGVLDDGSALSGVTRDGGDEEAEGGEEPVEDAGMPYYEPRPT